MIEPVDIVVGLLAVAVAVAVLVPLLTVAFGREISDERAKMLAGIVSALIAIVSLYVGARLNACEC